jgi:5-methylcytosine-specific restriction endonuclease McrA
MINIDEIRTGNELGYKCNCKYIFAACEVCGVGHWVQYIKGKANVNRCGSCSQKQRTDYSDINKLKQDGIECKKCGNVYPATGDYFPPHRHNRIGLMMVCRACRNSRTRDRLLEQGKIKYHKIFLTPKERRVSRSISMSIRRAITLGKNGRHWESLIGYTLKDLIKHIEKQFSEGMNWDNYGFNLPNNNPPRWHIDHIIPKSAFNLESPDSMDVKRCWALTNLQPLWGSENSKKGSQILQPFQPSLKITNQNTKGI